MSDDPLQQAEEFIREALIRETHEEGIRDGDKIAVDIPKDNFFGVPFRVDWDVAFNPGYWILDSCGSKGGGFLGSMLRWQATYTFHAR